MTNIKDDSGQTNFGFERVSFEQKKTLVNKVFSSVADKYDLMNDLMSFGLHRLWKDEFIKQISNLDSAILDVASGTGDIAFKIKERAKLYNKHPEITLCDINQEMLRIALNKAIDNNLLEGLNYVSGNAENLPFPDNSFDYYTIGFGIRNVAKIENALKSAFRVLKPGGRFLCLEFSKVSSDRLKSLYNFYSFNIIPKIGQIIAGKHGAYQYLAESINLFPDQESFATMIKEAGFNNVSYQNLTFGVCAIHSAYK